MIYDCLREIQNQRIEKNEKTYHEVFSWKQHFLISTIVLATVIILTINEPWTGQPSDNDLVRYAAANSNPWAPIGTTYDARFSNNKSQIFVKSCLAGTACYKPVSPVRDTSGSGGGTGGGGTSGGSYTITGVPIWINGECVANCDGTPTVIIYQSPK